MLVTEKQIDFAISLIETSGKSYEVIAKGSGVSKATLSRLVKLRQMTAYTRDMLASFFETAEKMNELGNGDPKTSCPLVAGVSDELKRLEGIFAEREARLRQQCDERVAALKAQNEMLQEHHNQALASRDKTYDKAVAYLKEDNMRLRAERDEYRSECEKLKVNSASQLASAQKAASDITSKKQVVFRCMVAITALSLVSLIISIVLR